ncbi:TAR DNA-binding protein 43-like [Planococcus citri]|uniref:TAR DNA-binding protein 43-like n=1 Tax=Planococcus citri TaxID=170843 RepID=UPI0031F9D70E
MENAKPAKRLRLYCSEINWIEKDNIDTKRVRVDGAETSCRLGSNNSHFVEVVNIQNWESIEIPCEDDKTLAVSVLTTYYPGAVGLRYFFDDRERAVKLSNQKLYPPEDGWTGRPFYCIYPQPQPQRKKNDSSKIEADDTLGSSESETEELAVLGIPENTTSADLRDYFSRFGDLMFAEANSEKCRRFGIIKFTDERAQAQVVSLRHRIHDQWCDVLVYKKATRRLLINA